MQFKSFKEHFEEYTQRVIPADASRGQIWDLELAFTGGALVMYVELMKATTLSDVDAEIRLSELKAELDAVARQAV